MCRISPIQPEGILLHRISYRRLLGTIAEPRCILDGDVWESSPSEPMKEDDLKARGHIRCAIIIQCTFELCYLPETISTVICIS
jgi:hypothetical protein